MRGVLRTIVVGAVVFVLVTVAVYEVVIYLRPARVSGGHPVMPLGQLITAIVAGVLGSVIAMVLDRRAARRE